MYNKRKRSQTHRMVNRRKLIPISFSDHNNIWIITIWNEFYPVTTQTYINYKCFAKSTKQAQGYCQPNKGSICYTITLHTHDEDLFYHPLILKLASETHTECILKSIKKLRRNYSKDKISNPKKITLYASIRPKITKNIFNPKFYNPKRNLKKLQPIQKGLYQITEKPTDITYKGIDHKIKN